MEQVEEAVVELRDQDERSAQLVGGADGPSGRASRRLTPTDREVASRVNGRWDVASIALACPLREVETLKSLRKLARLGLVELVERG